MQDNTQDNNDRPPPPVEAGARCPECGDGTISLAQFSDRAGPQLAGVDVWRCDQCTAHWFWQAGSGWVKRVVPVDDDDHTT